MYSSDNKQFLLDLPFLSPYLKSYLPDPSTLIFKSFYVLDASLSELQKLYECPEDAKLWDGNVRKVKVLSWLPGMNTKIVWRQGQNKVGQLVVRYVEGGCKGKKNSKNYCLLIE